mgnify:CR=1 FL=1
MISDIIEVKGIIFEDFINYKKPCMTLMMPKCNFKWDKEYGVQVCQNSGLAAAPNQTVLINDLMRGYKSNSITEAIVLQGLEPFDSLIDLYTVAAALEDFNITDDFVIYTGYTREELKSKLKPLYKVPGHLIIKWGRYIPNQQPHYDSVLGVYLASDNQYGEQLK